MKKLNVLTLLTAVLVSPLSQATTFSDLEYLMSGWQQAVPFKVTEIRKFFGPQKEFDAVCMEESYATTNASDLSALYDIQPQNGDETVRFEGKFDFVVKDSGKWGFDITLYPQFTAQGRPLRMSNMKIPRDLSHGKTMADGDLTDLSYDVTQDNIALAEVIAPQFIKAFKLLPLGTARLNIALAKGFDGKLVAKVTSSIDGYIPVNSLFVHSMSKNWSYTAFCELVPTNDKLSVLQDAQSQSKP